MGLPDLNISVVDSSEKIGEKHNKNIGKKMEDLVLHKWNIWQP